MLKHQGAAPSAASSNVRRVVTRRLVAIGAVRVRHAGRVGGRVQVRKIDYDDGQRLLRIARRGTGSVVT
ncbi:hypothetical protein ACIBL6_18350 [Streptomyces sp. NPDC050400]|uniref:hypothetical protein n=1 Tax=Streptomyces sp. NPDC050400 TaxID=3365610 RepID=UPI00378D17F5